MRRNREHVEGLCMGAVAAAALFLLAVCLLQGASIVRGGGRFGRVEAASAPAANELASVFPGEGR